jgi:hypothetical protein
VKCTLFAALRQNATKMILGNNCPAMEWRPSSQPFRLWRMLSSEMWCHVALTRTKQYLPTEARCEEPLTIWGRKQQNGIQERWVEWGVCTDHSSR